MTFLRPTPAIRRRACVPAIVSFATLLYGASVVAAQPQGDVAKRGSIQGEVVDRVSGAPLAHARVHVMSSDASEAEAKTGADGRFELSPLPPGDYSLWVTKFGYVTSTAGRDATLRQKKAERVRVIANEPQRVRVALKRASVLLGRVLAPDGEPAEGTKIQLFRLPYPGAQPRPVDWQVETNDAGEFRIPRVDAGTYLLMARPSVRLPTSGDGSVLAPTYYPSATSVAGATPIDVAEGATIAGLDIVLTEVKTTTVTGTVIDARGVPMVGGVMQVWADDNGVRVPVVGLPADSSGQIHDGGAFRLRLPAGEYWLTASSPEGGIGSYAADRPMSEEELKAMFAAVQQQLREQSGFASQRVTVGTEPVRDVTLQLEPPVAVRGRFVFEGRAPDPDAVMYAQVDMAAPSGGNGCRELRSPGVDAEPNGAFELLLTPGTCVPDVIAPPGWSLKAVQLGGVDVTQHVVHVEPGRPLGEMRVIFTDRRNALSFEVTDDSGATTTEFVAVVFPTDDTLWSQKKNIHLHVPGSPTRARSAVRHEGAEGVANGPYSDYSVPLGGLVPGEYHAIAVEDGAWDDLVDPVILRRLAAKAITFQLREGETRRLELRRAKGGAL